VVFCGAPWPIEDGKDEDNVRDQEGDDDEETVVGRFWKQDVLGSFWGNLVWMTLESRVHFESCASPSVAKVSWVSCEDRKIHAS